MSGFDLGAYLARIAFEAPPAPDEAGLAALQRAHRLAIPFENLDVMLGRPIRLDLASVFDKLVTRRRGGYCFEQSVLFGAALDALGFSQRPLLARVWLGQSEAPGRTHTLQLVDLEGGRWIADAGFGGSYTPPLPLVDGAEADTPDGARHRLRRDPAHGWLLERHGRPEHTDGRGGGAAGWVRQISFAAEPATPGDLLIANHWCATAPGTRFTVQPIVSAVLPRGFATLVGRRYRRANGAESIESEIASAKAYRVRLGLFFGLVLTVEEVDRLGLFQIEPATDLPDDPVI